MTIFREFQWIEHKKLNLLVSGETEFQHFMEKQKEKGNDDSRVHQSFIL